MNATIHSNGDDPGLDEPVSGRLPEATENRGAVDLGLPPLLSMASRAAMQRLLAAGVVLARTHEVDYNELVKNEAAIRQVLAEMGLRLVIRSGYKMAALVRVSDGDMLDDPEDEEDEAEEEAEGHRALLRVTRLKLLQTIVLLVLRGYHRERERAQDARIIIDIESLKDRTKPFWPLLNAESRSDRRFSGAIRIMERHGILLNVRENKDAREISPVITLALNAERFETLLAEFTRQIERLQAERGG